MKIEFRKVPHTPKELSASYSSVKIEGTFCKISPTLVKVQGNITGDLTLVCSRCGEEDAVTLDEESNFLICDGIYKSDSDEDELVIEIDDGIIDFDEILQSEISSMQSDYHICPKCEDCDFVEKEY